MRIHIDAERPAPRKLQPVVEALRRDQVVIYPTDTGYAFGCALSSPKAIASLRRLKGIDDRHAKPLTMLVKDLAEIGRYAHMGNVALSPVQAAAARAVYAGAAGDLRYAAVDVQPPPRGGDPDP
jgi:tRNA A37 threonylcarbamoyladenosine synthetase subunit TsaC/SUA5/YrdC